MINLNLPTSVGHIYTFIHDVLIGPLAQQGDPWEEIPMIIDADNLQQGGGICGEKGVFHEKSEGDVYCRPEFQSTRPNPTSLYPCYLITDVSYFSNPTVSSSFHLLYGDLAGGGYGYYVPSTGMTHKCSINMGDSIRVYTVTATKASPTSVTVSYVEIKGISLSSSKTTVLYQYRSVTMIDNSLVPPSTRILVPSGTWLTPRSRGEMIELVNRLAPYSLGTFTSSSATSYIIKGQKTVSPSQMKAQIIAWIASTMKGPEDPNVAVDYGDLAAKASENFNANQVNMIAFLRDLRRPQELIPKLHEMWRLKNMADNYLTINYGILPTIDDLNSIVAALKGVKPYLDRNGYQTVSAGHSATSVVGVVTFDLEQHVKVAVGNEDHGLLDLVNKIDSLGFLPTMENIWDLIPYSFVVDWFLDIGGLLARIDGYVRLLRYGVKYATMSQKRTASAELVPTPDFPYSGKINLVQYHRWVTDQCPEPPLSLNAPPDFDHWLESGALIIQRRK